VLPTPTVEFFSYYENAPLPRPASTDAMGTLPVRAVQYCLPLKAASGNGFYLYPPFDFAVRWDGVRSDFAWLDGDGNIREWLPLDSGNAVYHPSAADVLAAVPPDRAGVLGEVLDPEGPSFISADPRAPQTLEILTGIVVRTQPGWVSAVRSVANWASPRPFTVLDGVVETDWYRNDVPTTIRLNQPGEARFHRHLPLAQLQVVPLPALRPHHVNAEHPTGMAQWPDDVWREYVQVARARVQAERRGTYVSAAKRAVRTDRCPYPHPAG